MDSRPTFARSGWNYRNILEGRGTIDGLQEHVLNPAYQDTDTVFLIAGYNDVVQAPDDSDLLESRASLAAILDLIDNNWDVDIFVANISNFPLDRQWAHKQSNVETLNDLIESEVAQRAKTHLVDINSFITNDLVRADGLHVNNDGQELIGAAFAAQVAAIQITPVPEPNSICVLAAALFFQSTRRTRRCSR